MGTYRQARITVVPYSITNGEPIEDFPMGRLQGVTVEIEGARTQTDFDVIEIVDDNNPYPAQLGIDWATDMNGVINLKKRNMICEKKSLRVVIPSDPTEGLCYTKLAHDYESDNDLDFIYKITA